VAVDNAFVYWTNSDPDPRHPSSSIGRADLDGQNANQDSLPYHPGPTPWRWRSTPG
jgi:hypothetical protein